MLVFNVIVRKSCRRKTRYYRADFVQTRPHETTQDRKVPYMTPDRMQEQLMTTEKVIDTTLLDLNPRGGLVAAVVHVKFCVPSVWQQYRGK